MFCSWKDHDMMEVQRRVLVRNEFRAEVEKLEVCKSRAKTVRGLRRVIKAKIGGPWFQGSVSVAPASGRESAARWVG